MTTRSAWVVATVVCASIATTTGDLFCASSTATSAESSADRTTKVSTGTDDELLPRSLSMAPEDWAELVFMMQLAVH